MLTKPLSKTSGIGNFKKVNNQCHGTSKLHVKLVQT